MRPEHHPLRKELKDRFPHRNIYYGTHTGRTTILALRLIANAMRNPGVPQIAQDHRPKTEDDVELLDMAMKYIEKLGFEFFYKRKTAVVRTLKFGMSREYFEHPLRKRVSEKYPGTDSWRGVGESTILALKYIAIAMENPTKPVFVVDHHDSKIADKHLLRMIWEYIERLEFRYFKFNRAENTLTFGP